MVLIDYPSLSTREAPDLRRLEQLGASHTCQRVEYTLIISCLPSGLSLSLSNCSVVY